MRVICLCEIYRVFFHEIKNTKFHEAVCFSNPPGMSPVTTPTPAPIVWSIELHWKVSTTPKC
ncbi:hypothetical protein EMIT0196MI5_210062 [Pseudomonas sp. IT-196MI5]